MSTHCLNFGHELAVYLVDDQPEELTGSDISSAGLLVCQRCRQAYIAGGALAEYSPAAGPQELGAFVAWIVSGEHVVDAYGLPSVKDFVAVYAGTFASEQEFARSFAEDRGLVDSEAQWPHTYIDWERATPALMADFWTERVLDGIAVFRNHAPGKAMAGDDHTRLSSRA